jgi:hypothetical protein
MRFVAIKTEAQQAAGIHKVGEMLVKQRTMLINSLREFGIVVAEGPRRQRADGDPGRSDGRAHPGTVARRLDGDCRNLVRPRATH